MSDKVKIIAKSVTFDIVDVGTAQQPNERMRDRAHAIAITSDGEQEFRFFLSRETGDKIADIIETAVRRAIEAAAGVIPQ